MRYRSITALAMLAVMATPLAPGAMAQSATRPQSRPDAPTSLLNMPPDNVVGDRRKVTLVQIGAAGEKLGTPVEMDCPRSGCETLLDLKVEENSWKFFANISFVSRGLYLTLEPRSIGIANVMEFSAGHAGPAFVPFRGKDLASAQLRFVVTLDGSVRSQERDTDPNAIGSTGVFTRKRIPDILLQVDASALIPAPKPEAKPDAKPGAKAPP